MSSAPSGLVASLLGGAMRLLRYGRAYLVVWACSEANRIRSIGQRPRIHWKNPHGGEDILLVALFQKGALRDDTRNLLRAAKKRGMYVYAVNSLRLADPDSIRNVADAYVERFNFGRDFGSYRQGFRDILENDDFAGCGRLIFMNDSVFVCRERVERFLKDMTETECGILGATENHEIEYHLGSFCVSIRADVLRHPRFRAYWRRYRNSDVRPTVIRRGEMGLSKVLRSCARGPDDVRALYDSSRFHDLCTKDDAFLAEAVVRARTSDLNDWKRLSIRSAVEAYSGRFMRPALSGQPILRETAAAGDVQPMRQLRMATVGDADDYFREVVGGNGGQPVQGRFRDFLAALATDVFMAGSQIHQNAAILLRMGLPIVKLDGLYRGMFSVGDVNRILECLCPEDAALLRRQLFRRPFGGDTLRGWKRDAFFVGLI